MTKPVKVATISKTRSAAGILFLLAGILAFVVPTSIIYFNKVAPSIGQLPLNNWGDFLAGAFGPASLLVLAAGFLLQQEELRLQREELRETRATLNQQKEELKRAAEESQKQSNILEIQVRIAEWQNGR